MTKKCLGFGLLLMAAVCVIGFSSCDNKNNNVDPPSNNKEYYDINVNVENGSSYSSIVDSVKAVTEGDEGDVVIKTVAYNNGVFTLQLPSTISENLYPFAEDAPEGLIFSNPNVKVMSLYTDAYKNDYYVGYVQYVAEEASLRKALGIYMYADSNCSITGYAEEASFNINLKTGWNLIYMRLTDAGDVEFTTTPQTGLKWVFYGDNYPYAPKKAHERSSLFK
jgi:hypothetical protein